MQIAAADVVRRRQASKQQASKQALNVKKRPIQVADGTSDSKRK